MRKLLVPVLIAAFVAASAGISADPLLKRAAEAQAAGRTAVAASLYRQWLHANPDAPGSARVFSSYFGVERDFATLLSESRGFLANGRGMAGAADEFLRVARLLDVAGRLEDARDAYLLAFQEGASDLSLLRAGLLCVEMNDAAAFADIIARGKGRASTALLDALSDYRSGDREAASRQLVDLASRTGDPDIALKAMWILSQGAGASAASRAAIGARFTGSPEAALSADAAGGGRGAAAAQVRLSPSPSPLAFVESLDSSAPAAAPPTPSAPGPSAAPMSVPAPAATPPASQPVAAPDAPASPPDAPASPPDAPASPPPAAVTAASLYMVQAGAFQVRENADDLVAELAKKGFAASVLVDMAQGRQRFRVLAGSGLANDQAQALLASLAKAGYSGFVAAQKPAAQPDATSSSPRPSG